MGDVILTIEDIITLTHSASPEFERCHVYGVFKLEEKVRSQTYWILNDNTFPKGLKIRLNGPIADYPKPKPGDIVRIHRLKTNTVIPEVVKSNTVVVWPSSKYNPTPIYNARSPTFTEEDEKRRRQLELLFFSTLECIGDTVAPNSTRTHFDIAGRVKTKAPDQFHNLEIVYIDDTGEFTLRVFPKRIEKEDNSHFEVAQELKPGDLFFATNCKRDLLARRLNLSANLEYGRSLRRVEPQSVLGVKLSERCPEVRTESPTNDHTENESQSQAQSQAQSQVQSQDEPRQGTNASHANNKRLRRSPIITRSRARNSNSPQNSTTSGVSLSQRTSCDSQPQSFIKQQIITVSIPEYTKQADIPKKDSYAFYNIVGEIRGQPHETSKYGNWVFQIFDGSRHDIPSFHIHDVVNPQDKCLVVYVYSKQKETDTNDHIEKVKNLKPGDFVYVRNVKASWHNGRLKLEMSANLNHNKSIEVIGRNTPFGDHIHNLVSWPEVPESTANSRYIAQESAEAVDPSGSAEQINTSI